MSDIPPGYTKANWDSRIWPADVVAYLLSKLLTGSPFANALTAAPTTSGQMVWPLVWPEGAAWLSELQLIPSATPNGKVYTVGVCKIANRVLLSNESIDDTGFPLANATGRAIADSLGPKLDSDFLYGEGGLAPKGVWDNAPAAAEATDFRSAAISAWGELADAGAQVETIIVCARPRTIAAEWSRVDDYGQPLHGDGPTDALTLGPGIVCLPVPMLEPPDVLALNRSLVFRVIRDDFRINSADDFERDRRQRRVIDRFAVAAPVPEKSLRKVTIAEGA
jgi:Phage capsid family